MMAIAKARRALVTFVSWRVIVGFGMVGLWAVGVLAGPVLTNSDAVRSTGNKSARFADSRRSESRSIVSPDPMSELLKNAIQVANYRHMVHAENIANAGRSDYQSKGFDHDSDLTTTATISTGKPVVIETEMSRLTEMRMRQQALLEIVSKRQQIRRTVVMMGKGG